MSHPTQNQAAEAKAAHVSPSHYHNDKEQVSKNDLICAAGAASITPTIRETERRHPVTPR
jgi:hypothetical protein